MHIKITVLKYAEGKLPGNLVKQNGTEQDTIMASFLYYLIQLDDTNILVDVGDKPMPKYYQNYQPPVSILNETVKYYDADGKLITESIVEYSGKNLKRVYERYEDFEQEWYRADSKKDFLNSLFNEGVMIDALYDKVNDNIDIFDILSNMAYGEEVVSKDDRIEKVKNSDFINEYNDSQKSVIDELLNTYKNHDVVELENIRILEVKNFNKFGGLVPIVNLFGGKDKYLRVISNIKNALYS